MAVTYSDRTTWSNECGRHGEKEKQRKQRLRRHNFQHKYITWKLKNLSFRWRPVATFVTGAFSPWLPNLAISQAKFLMLLKVSRSWNCHVSSAELLTPKQKQSLCSAGFLRQSGVTFENGHQLQTWKLMQPSGNGFLWKGKCGRSGRVR